MSTSDARRRRKPQDASNDERSSEPVAEDEPAVKDELVAKGRHTPEHGSPGQLAEKKSASRIWHLLSCITIGIAFAVVFWDKETATHAMSAMTQRMQPAWDTISVLQKLSHTTYDGNTAGALANPCVLAIGDLHGDVFQAEKALRLVGAVDDEGEWNAPGCVLVQTGDLVDRGRHSLDTVRRFIRLRESAAQHGGKVISLLGNHELMSLQGQLQYVSRQELADLGRQHILNNGDARALWAQVPRHLKPVVVQFPAGVIQRGAAVWSSLVRKDGWLGEWIRSLPAAVIVGEGECRTLFVHAGLTPNVLHAARFFPARGVAEPGALGALNAAVADMLAACDAEGPCPALRHGNAGFMFLGDDGPFWHRDYALGEESAVCGLLAKVLKAVGAKQAVSGHTVQMSGRIESRCQGTLYLIDVGMSRAYAGTVGAWKCVNGSMSVLP